MRKLTVLVLLAACELQPAPKQEAPPPAKPAPTEAAKPTPTEAAKPVETPPTPPAPVETSAACKEVGVKIAQLLIDGVTDPAQKSIYEKERGNIARKTAEACTAQAWSEEARTCYLGAKSAAELKGCETMYTPPKAQPAPSPAK
jgi:hypothetical protein